MKEKWITRICNALTNLCAVVLCIGVLLGRSDTSYPWRVMVGSIATVAAIAWGYRATQRIGTKNGNGFNFLAMFVVALANFFA